MISKKMQRFIGGSSLIRNMFEEGTRRKKKYGEENVFDFSIGNPNLPPPQEVTDRAIELLKNEDPVRLHGYMANSGFPDVREKIAAYLERNYDYPGAAENIIMTVGAAAGLNIVLKCILDEGDEVITFSPYFLEYGNYAYNYGAELVDSPLNREDFSIDLDAFEAAISEKTKAVIINNPHNPTGVVFSAEEIQGLADILEKKQEELGKSIVLVSDEPYRELAYDGVNVPAIANFYDNTIICYSYSKSLSLPGERIGYTYFSPRLDNVKNLIEVATIANRISGFVNAPSLFQLVVGDCVDAQVDLSFYDRNRKDLYDIVTGAGFEAVYPQGAFYLWMKTIGDDVDFCNMAKEHNILMVPGSAFKCSGYARLAYCVSNENIRNSKKAFESLAEEYR